MVRRFTGDLDMWVFYIKSLFVFQSRYETVHHESMGLFFEKLLNTPKSLRAMYPHRDKHCLTFLNKIFIKTIV